jgi:hypothetical protein
MTPSSSKAKTLLTQISCPSCGCSSSSTANINTIQVATTANYASMAPNSNYKDNDRGMGNRQPSSIIIAKIK